MAEENVTPVWSQTTRVSGRPETWPARAEHLGSTAPGPQGYGAGREGVPGIRMRSEPVFASSRGYSTPAPSFDATPPESDAPFDDDWQGEDALSIGSPGFEQGREPGLHGGFDEERAEDRRASEPYAQAPVSRGRSLASTGWMLLVLIGLIALGLQAIYVYRNDIATRFPATRGALVSACVRLHCQVGFERRIERISVMSSSLRPPPGATPEEGHSRFVFRAVLRNRYDNPQPYPALVLDLTDFSDTVVARKIITAQHYLPSGQAELPFAPGADVNVEVPLDVTDLSVNGFQVDKFFP